MVLFNTGDTRPQHVQITNIIMFPAHHSALEKTQNRTVYKSRLLQKSGLDRHIYYVCKEIPPSELHPIGVEHEGLLMELPGGE